MILKPFKQFSANNITQGFHQYHKAIDILPIRKGGLAYGTPLVAPERCKIGKVYTPQFFKDNPHDDAPVKNGYGLFMKGLETGYLHLYWHTQPVFPVSTGDMVERGAIVAYCGNSGNVFSGGLYVPISERNLPNFKGTHLHQVLIDDRETPQRGTVLNPLDYMDIVTEPTYTIFDELKAISTTLLKISKLLS